MSMHVDEPGTKERLGRLVQNITSNRTLWDDLHQEALIHLWTTEVHRPGQTQSWYLQSCKYHLLHYLASGRSVDSVKREGGRLQTTEDSEDEEGFTEQGDSGDSVFTLVSARDIISLLSPQLVPREKAVLDCFA